MTPVVDRWGTGRTQEQIDAIWCYHARRLHDPFAAHLYLLEVYGLRVRRGAWRAVRP
jgi:hypothetical protein